MVEPEAKLDLLDPELNPAAAMMRVVDGKSSNSAAEPGQSLHETHQLVHSPTHHIGPFHHLGPGQHAESIVALEAELQRAHKELGEVKEQLAASESGKALALRELTNIKTLLDQISRVEHFAASDDVEVETAPLPPNWSDRQQDPATEIDRLRNELEASRNLNSTFAAELDRAKEEIDGARYESVSLELRMETSRLQSEVEAGRDQQGRLSVELENAKKDIRTLQATLSDAWSHQGTCALDLARAKEEIAWLEADLDAAQSLTLEIARAKDNVRILQSDLGMARRLRESLSNELLEAQEEISRLRTQHAASAGLASANSALQCELEELRRAHETSTSELRQEISAVRAKYQSSVSESTNAQEEICRLQGESTAKGREFAIMLRATEEESQELQTKLEEVIGQYYHTCTELAEATRQNESVHVKYESCSSELFRVKEEVFRHEVEHLASHEDLLTDINIAQEENLKLQAEVATLKDERSNLSGELAQSREETHQMEMRHYSACSELYKDIAWLQSELAALEGQHGACSRELDRIRDVFQMDLTQVQEIHDIFLAELIHANEEVRRLQLDSTVELERSLEVVRSLKEEVSKVKIDLSMQYSVLMVEKSLTEKKMEEVSLEFLATSARLQEVIAAQKTAESELAEVTTKEAAAASTLRADLGAARDELETTREAEVKLQVMTEDLEELRAQLSSRNQSMETTALHSELRASMNALHLELEAVKKSEAKYRETVSNSQSRIEDLERHLYEARYIEAKAREALVLKSSDLQKVIIELAIAKEALEWVGGDNAALSGELAANCAELEAKNAEVVSTKEREARAKEREERAKEGEARAKAAFTDYSLKLQRMKLELEDASMLTDKAKSLELELDEVAAKLEKATESERNMAASLASLQAELNNAVAELAATREDHGIALAEKEQQYELELNLMRTQWEVAVMAEAEDASFDVGQATKEAEKARQEVEELQVHIDTLEAKLETLQLEVEAAKASEEWAFAQMRLKTIPEYDEETDEEGLEAPVSWKEFQSLKAKTKELQEVVNKRAAVRVAEVNEARAREQEMQRRMTSVERELRTCREELSEAITKREEAEATKFSCEAALRDQRLERRKSLSHSGHWNGSGSGSGTATATAGPPSRGKFMNPGDRQGSLNGSTCLDDSQSSSSPSRSSLSFASFASPGRSPLESSLVGQQVLSTRTTPAAEERPRKLKLASKIGQYFNKKKILV